MTELKLVAFIQGITLTLIYHVLLSQHQCCILRYVLIIDFFFEMAETKKMKSVRKFCRKRPKESTNQGSVILLLCGSLKKVQRSNFRESRFEFLHNSWES